MTTFCLNVYIYIYIYVYDISDTIPVSSDESSHIVQNNEDEQKSRGDYVEMAEQNKDGGKLFYYNDNTSLCYRETRDPRGPVYDLLV